MRCVLVAFSLFWVMTAGCKGGSAQTDTAPDIAAENRDTPPDTAAEAKDASPDVAADVKEGAPDGAADASPDGAADVKDAAPDSAADAAPDSAADASPDTGAGDRAVGSLPPAAAILFVSDRDTKKVDPTTNRKEIYAANADGSAVTRLTFSPYHHFIFGIDKARSAIVASRAEADTKPPAGLGDEDRRSLWLLDLASGAERRLTDPSHHAEGRSFSPDGEWIVFCMSLTDGGQNDVYKIRRDGTTETNLTNTAAAAECDASWSHDGKQIAFDYLDAALPVRMRVKTMDPDGASVRLVYDASDGIDTPVFPRGAYDPAWSPDDEWLVFERPMSWAADVNFGSGIWHIFKVKADGTGAVDLSASGGHGDRAEYLPSFSPDGKRVIFGSLFHDKAMPLNSHVSIMAMDAAAGGSLSRITRDATDMHPQWIP